MYFQPAYDVVVILNTTISTRVQAQPIIRLYAEPVSNQIFNKIDYSWY
jgi:hypothetical protein